MQNSTITTPVPAATDACKRPQVTLVPMTPDEWSYGGKRLSIHYSFAESPFGSLIIGTTHKGVCHLAFYDGSTEAALAGLKKQFPNARYQPLLDKIQQNALFCFTGEWRQSETIALHVKGTPFQFKVWQALLDIPMGRPTTYGELAQELRQPGAARAVGTALGDNTIAWLIPCHRVVRSGGEPGQYRWGSARKLAILEWESAKTARQSNN